MDGTGDRVVLDRGEFVRIIAEHSDLPSDISRIMGYVESVFMLQSDENRPAYVFEVDFDRMDVESFIELNEGLKLMKVAAILVPKKSVAYLGEVTPSSLGIRGKIAAFRQRIRNMCSFIVQYGDDEDER